ncbi:DUF1281 domain-containing protein [Erwinia pyrifoliae]|uniref:DUF1281 domain-containing protein n=1 Tax=Erwinia pyrifoliae TaxID=79967 RepID=D0UIY1_ERWPY|nr:DUF1281 domain-containing protein [Erwinia pyrifoliae]ACY01290.1 unknown [Erwinia pyrifoliae]AUX71602.1 DUF1281 domain-containing protein [Erwinia pyrifoliae]AUX73929.1 DUF1281 domain-containing protein [Erwinia pyrifoliae]MCA8875735.1 DUF1281 domain-containing protein [Erwinia pyrifoliae]MCA8878174.1 DUF1281 domain-containing protein [Erwinia pyrifoliae]
MFSWCHNRLDITGKSVCIDVMQSWIVGTETPRYRHAIRQAIKLFLAGCAGILKPVKATTYPAYPALTASGLGAQTSANHAFQHFLELLEKDAWLDGATLSRMEKIWLQSGIDGLKWENIPLAARQIISQLVAVHYADWFGVASGAGQFDPQERWDSLSIMPETTCPCDMLMVMPSRLATELNGTSGLFSGLNTTSELYMQLFGMEFPAGHQARWSREDISSLALTLSSPGYPPSGEVMGQMSSLFDCEIRHYWISQDTGLSGYNCFDRGDHVDSGPYPSDVRDAATGGEGARIYLLAPEASGAGAAQYGSVRA